MKSVTEWLTELGLQQYAPAFEENAIDADTLPTLTDADLKELGIAILGHRKKILAAIEHMPKCETGFQSLADLATQLPLPLALPAFDFAGVHQGDSKLRLWALSDLMELGARLAVAIGLAEHGGNPPEELRKELALNMQIPTFGRWLAMARDVSRHLPKTAAFPSLPEFVRNLDEVLCPRKDNDVHGSVFALRNRLAHGGGLMKSQAKEILSSWEKRVPEIVQIFGLWRDVSLILHAPGKGSRLLRGSETSSWEEESGSSDVQHGIVARIGDRFLNIQPLLWTVTPENAKQISGIYSRRGEVCLEYTPFEGDITVLEADIPESFLSLFRRSSPPSKFQHQDVFPILEKEARRLVGREHELDQLLKCIESLPPGGLLYVEGLAGMGKSCLMAAAAVQLQECQHPKRLLLPYRFKAGGGDMPCSVGAFLGYALERIESWEGLKKHEIGKKITKESSPRDRFIEILSYLREDYEVLVLADGLDELPPTEDSWLENVVFKSVESCKSVRWILASRPERDIGTMIRKAGASEPFPRGLPPMRQEDVRSFFLEKLGVSKTRNRLIQRDEEKGGCIYNPFLREGHRAVGRLACVYELRAGRFNQKHAHR